MKDGYLETVEIDCKKKLKRMTSLLTDLDELDSDEGVSLSSSLYLKNKESKKDKKKDKPEIEVVGDELFDNDWMDTLTNFTAPKANKKSKIHFDGFEKKKKKKDKKKDGQTVNHKKNFEPELALLRNLQIEQNKFVDSLQKKYDQMENTKSTARGVGKYTTDLINSITSARSVSMQLIDKVISTKKTIADLEFKERKEFGSGNSSEQQNLNNYASTYLKQIMSVGRGNIMQQPTYVQEYDEPTDDDLENIFDSIDENLGEVERDSDVEKYLKYENENVTIKVIWRDDYDDDDLENKYDYVAVTQDGKILDDYPLPEKTRLNINRSTNIAIDKYGNKYQMEVV